MKKLIALILFPFLTIPFGTKANENYSVEIEAVTLVMEQYKKNTESSIDEFEIEDKKLEEKFKNNYKQQNTPQQQDSQPVEVEEDDLW